jgi:hypothetical protein
MRKGTDRMTTTQREAQLLEAMKYASLEEQRRLAGDLEQLRAEATAEAQSDRDIELADSIVLDHLTPVLVHGFHSAATDWLGEDTEYTTADLHEVGQSMRAEASLWYRTVTDGVKANRSELREQAKGVARRLGSQYGEIADQASSIFLEYIGQLVTAEGTDMGNIPSAAGDNTNPNSTPWDEEATAEGIEAPIDGQAPPAADAPEAPEGSGLPAGDAPPAAAASSPSAEPTDDAPHLAPELSPEDSFDPQGPGAADTSASVEATRRTAAAAPERDPWGSAFTDWTPENDSDPLGGDGKGGFVCGTCGKESDTSSEAAAHHLQHLSSARPFESAQQRAIRQFLGVEEGQEFPVPGEVDPEQDGEAESSLPYYRGPTQAPGTFDNFIQPTPASGDTSSTRAPNVTASLHTANQYIRKDGDDWVITQKGTGKVLSRHDSEAKAQSAFEAMESHMHGSLQTEAIATGPNPQGSFVYDPIKVESKGYEEGFAYAITWTPGRPLPAALSSAVGIGDKYNAEYVLGYKRGVADGVGSLSDEYQTAFANSAKAAVLSSKQVTALTYGDLEPGDNGKGRSLHCKDCGDGPYSADASDYWNANPTHPITCGSCGGEMGRFRENRVLKEEQKTATPNTLQTNTLDQNVAWPFTWDTGAPSAADVGNVPTPGASVADYPQPGAEAPEASVGTPEEEIEPVVDEEPDPAKLASFQQVVAHNRRLLGV